MGICSRNTLLLSILLTLLAFVPACQDTGPLVEVDVPTDYRLVFTDGSWLKNQAIFYGVITFSGEDQLLLHLRGTNGQMTATVAKEWSNEINRKRPGIAQASSNTLLIHRVKKIETYSRLLGIKLTEIGPSK